ncbi:Cyclin B2;1 [Arabidopsis thaliana]|jgi:cyclin B|uniref:Cyclin-B2-1 n=1 Tax=Arabidopsis thaliana TaxID=3702 RepID=CCB21_ARATH|nr:Cyclin B2;1 [Arabidopsis thaliana]Q39068.2 RecName: Full=Cyclin-B2-1; AltName: Full=Cyc2a-At; AltName: Full=Cyclin-2a; AltName: Full=G2/mitotic-specific cyclin-B2-1; Short=CycB2;1 [Arabidopsis thaliana]AAD32949.1 putative cyclin 2 [Arabidopsis thaliana]AEC06658.1 Cyclin B2;1 [Arabidopsis thaliana]|eukprot:NP_179353.1 Cyclin B2;1 [Arabidopsis thaliana]
MVNSCENKIFVKPTSTTILQDETRSRKFGQEMKREKRRVLRVINQNLAGARVYPCVVNKRGSLLSNKQEEEEGCQKKKFDSLRPSVTRSGVEEETNKKLKPSVPSANDFGDCIFIDEEEATLDLPMPMSLEKPYIEADPMEEVEMEDVTVEEPIVDIDVLDSKNSLAAVEYVQDLYAFYRTMERFSCVPVDYMMQQIDLNEKMRAILIDWLIEVHDKFDLINETLFLTVNLIDRFLSKQNVMRKKLQLVGLVALLLACKYEEVSVPVVEDLVLISDKAYTRNDVLEMEKTMLSTLQFNISLPTQYPFLKRFLKAAQADKKCEVLASFLIELALVEYEMLRFPPSLLAATSVYTAQCTLDGSRKWNSTCEFHCHYSEDQLMECSRKLVSLHQRAATGNLTGVYRKYSTSKFGYIAKCEAAHFLVSESHHS